jgi:hypothetical protein
VVDSRVTVREAALRLGVSEGAIRKRVDRGTLRSEKGDDGRVYVYLPAGEDTGEVTSTTLESNVLISEMRDQIEFLRRELERKDTILMNMTEAMKSLTPATPEPPEEAASEPRRSPEAASGEPYGTSPQEAEESLQRRSERDPSKRSWWRKFFGFE